MFKNLGNLGQMAGLLKNFGQIKTKISQKKEELATQVVSGEVTGGSVKIEMNGLGQVLKVAIDPVVLTPELQTQLEGSIQEAANIAIANAKKLHVAAIREMTDGLPIPGLDGILEEMSS